MAAKARQFCHKWRKYLKQPRCSSTDEYQEYDRACEELGSFKNKIYKEIC